MEQPKSRKPPRVAVAENSPWMPPRYELADVSALQALQRGEASAEQQRRALKWLIGPACGAYDMSYRPGEDGRRDTDFAEGRRFVGLQIVKLLNADISKLRRNDGSRTSEPSESGG